MIKDWKIKVCGMRNPVNIRNVADYPVDWMGLIFYLKSPRGIVYQGADMIDQIIQVTDWRNVKRVGVFVDEEDEIIEEVVQKYQLHGLQFHGSESPGKCAHFRQQDMFVIKAFSVDDAFDFSNCAPYLDVCDYFLFDTKGKEKGGNGITFNWKILNKYPYDKPFLLSGGIGPGDEAKIRQLNFEQLVGIDINSRFERVPGMKNQHSIAVFLNNLGK